MPDEIAQFTTIDLCKGVRSLMGTVLTKAIAAEADGSGSAGKDTSFDAKNLAEALLALESSLALARGKAVNPERGPSPKLTEPYREWFSRPQVTPMEHREYRSYPDAPR